MATWLAHEKAHRVCIRCTISIHLMMTWLNEYHLPYWRIYEPKVVCIREAKLLVRGSCTGQVQLDLFSNAIQLSGVND